MSDYSMMGSFGTGGASALSGDLITKLRDAEEASVIKPIDTKIDIYQDADKLFAKLKVVNL